MDNAAINGHTPIYPEDWHFWSKDRRIAWHMDRVSIESEVFNQLESEGLMTEFEPPEVYNRLKEVRRNCKMVEGMLKLVTDPQFQTLRFELSLHVGRASECIRERVRLLNIQMRRTNFRSTPEEDALLRELKTKVYSHLDDGEKVEGEIIKMCDACNVDFAPFMMVDEVRSRA